MTSEDAHASVALSIVDLSRLLRKRFETHLASVDTGVTVAEARTLAFIARLPEMRQAMLAERMSVEPMTLVGYLDSLEKSGLVARVVDPSDRRAKLVQLTDTATDVVDKILTIAAQVREEAMTGIAEEKRDELESMLLTMKTNLLRGCNNEPA